MPAQRYRVGQISGRLPAVRRVPPLIPTPIAKTITPPHYTFKPGDRLHVGCGGRRLPGWVNADVVPGVGDVVLDLSDPVALPRDALAAIYASHVLEHCYAQDTPGILRRMRDALRPGGVLRLSVPDLRLVVRNCLDSQAYGGETSALAVLYGGDFSSATSGPDQHRQMFWKERLTRLLTEAGFANIREWKFGQYPEIDALGDYATNPRGDDGKSLISLNLEAVRPGATRQLPTQPTARSVATGFGVDVSVLLGTVNRPEMLKECIASVRGSLQSSPWRHEIVVAYGNESETSLPWLRAQADVIAVKGGMTGAIDAFNVAYRASRGRFICQLNDDVLVDGSSIATALNHLNADASCAGVVFKFDRGDGDGYRHEYLGDTLHPNQIVVRREVCEAVIERIGDFWGDQARRTDKTYGGDSAFGVLCRALGFRLDSLDGVSCRDRCHEANDSLRAGNQPNAAHSARWRAMYEPMIKAPFGSAAVEFAGLYLPRLGMAPMRSPVAAGKSLRLLLLSLQTPQEPQLAQRQALAKIGPTEDVSWYPFTEEKARAILDLARKHKPDVVFSQVQSACIPASFLKELRAAVGQLCTLVNWTGDVRTDGSAPAERWMIPYGDLFDLCLFDNTSYPRQLKSEESAKADCGYLSCGVDLTQNSWVEGAEEDGTRPVFLGTNYRHLDGGERESVLLYAAKALVALGRNGVRIHGQGWSDSRASEFAHGPLAQQAANSLMRSAPITISMSLFQTLGRYTSDRLKRALASGAVVAVREFPDMGGLGLRSGENCLSWTTEAELVKLCDAWLGKSTDERMQLRRRAASLAHDRFGWDRVTEELLAIVRAHRGRKGLAC